MTDSTIYRPRMISVPASPYCELARWALDRWGIPYIEECHAPVFQVSAARRLGGSTGVPVVDTGEAYLLNAREVVDYYEARSPGVHKLYPPEGKARADARNLFDFFFDRFGIAVQAWVCAYMLPARNVTVPAWTEGVPLLERWCAHIFYPVLSALVRGSLTPQPDPVAGRQAEIELAFDQVESRLADGRPFLMGDRFTAPDLALAALSAPILLPTEYGRRLPALEELPSPMRDVVQRWRARPAGQFVLRLYRENRPERSPDLIGLGGHSSGRTFADKLANFLIAPGILRPIFTFLRRFFPIGVIGTHAIVTRYDDVIEVLKRDRDFTISQINADKINKIDGPFILGMDASPQYDREDAVLHQAVRREDLSAIREFVAQAALELIEAARPRRRIDVVNGLARVVPVRLVAAYFGMPGPNDPTMMRWMRDIFHYIFANLTNAPSVLQDALNSCGELRRHMDVQIALRKSQRAGPAQNGTTVGQLLVKQGKSQAAGNQRTLLEIDPRYASSTNGLENNDDILGRLLALQDSAHPWLDDNAVRRNLGGVIVGAVDTTSKFVALAMDELLRRPKALAQARDAALSSDIEAVRRYAWEAVRFNPHHPLQARFCPQEAGIAAGQNRSRNIVAGSSVYVATLSAMFDPEAFDNPNEFTIGRQAEYLHFGYGMHTCFGKHINEVQIAELVAALLRLPNLRRATGSAGRMLFDGPFPNRLVLEFDA